MHILDLELEGFTVHAKTALHFPDRGVVLVTGPNGSGKSSIVEGVAFGGYGETLRSTVPGGREATACLSHLCLRMHNSGASEAAQRLNGKYATNLIVERTRKKDKASLEWDYTNGPSGSVPKEWPTMTKAQEALEAVIGTFAVWRRTHVFSSADAARFTDATDKERKQFLESWAGIERFDDALGKCRLEWVQAEQRLAVSQGRAQMLKAEIDSIQKRKADSERALAVMPPPAPPGGYETQLTNLRHSIKATETSIRELREEMQKLERSSGAHDADLWALEQRRKRLTKPGQKCGECNQPLPDSSAEREKLEAEAAALKKTAEAAKAAVQGEINGIKEQIADDERTMGRLREKERAASKEAGAVNAMEQSRRLATETLKAASAELEEATAKATKLLEELPVQAKEMRLMKCAEVVLGLRGVRAGLLARLLGGLEAAANAWLPKVAGQKLRLELKPYSEKKGGGATDAISLTVHGAGGGEGYKATSQGERRRLDVALLLAFAGSGTLFFDEVFDALDTDGLEAVIQVLGELSAERCVVVITHSEELATRVPHVKHWRVQDGRVSA